MARLVINHSTSIEGLMKWLKKLSINEKIQTITPGVIAKAKGRQEKLEIKVSRKTNEGFRLLARKGGSVQEVYVVTKLSEIEIELAIKNTNPSLSHKKKS